MKYQLPAPNNWQDFEDICHYLWRSIWGDPATHKNGRQGQPQHGVDIWGRASYEKEYSGVQCKGKEVNWGRVLTKDELTDEANKVDDFTPSLKHFIVATTSPSDAGIQEVCRNINFGRKHNFDVDVWSWDEIAEEIQYRQEVFERFYPRFQTNDFNDGQVCISRNAESSRIRTFLSRDYVRNDFSCSMYDLVLKLVFELVDNAFRHSNTTSVSIRYEQGGRFTIEYKGPKFDTRSIKQNGRGGHITYDYITNLCQEHLSITYDYTEDSCTNITHLEFSKEIRKSELKPIEIEIPPEYGIFSRKIGGNMAETMIDQYKYLGVKIKILVKSEFLMSGCIAFFSRIFEEMRDQIISVSFPDEDMLKIVMQLCESYGIKYSIR